jgi:hypothetical protein
MQTKQNTEDPMLAAIERICSGLESAGVAGKGTSAAIRTMSNQWTANGGKVNPGSAIGDIETAMELLEKVRTALAKQAEPTGPIKLVPTKFDRSVILSESAPLPMGTIRVSDMNFGVPRAPETDKIMMSILKGKPGKQTKAAMEIMDGRAGLIAWHEKNVGSIANGTSMPIQELLEAVASAMYQQATAS